MKISLGIFSFLFLLVFLSGCNSKPSIVGRWKPVDMEMPGVPEEIKREMLQSSELQFNENNTYVSIGPDGRRRTGKYLFDEKRQLLAINGGLRPVDRLRIISFQRKKLILLMQGYKILLEKQ